MKEDDLSGGSFNDIPNEKWQKFFDKFIEHTTLETASWKPVHLLAYFCVQYQQTYGSSYAFKYNSPSPSKSFEIFQVKKMAQIISSKSQILKDYIDWVFNKVEKEKRRFTSISFLTREEVIKEYKMTVLLAQKITRATTLSSKILTDINDEMSIEQIQVDHHLKTYGDLAFLSQIPDHPIHKVVMKALEKNGITIKQLREIK